MSEKYLGADKTAEVCMIWPNSAASQMEKIIEQCRITDSDVNYAGDPSAWTAAWGRWL